MDFQLLIDAAKQKLGFRQLSQFAEAGSVAAALATADGQIYTGICIDTSCSMGFCAEQAAAAQMITDGQQRVLQMVAINSQVSRSHLVVVAVNSSASWILPTITRRS